ncbi:hypothetical protein AY600_05195 [Phormidium willei BDU 130791]|nr:hypothetical protein AY600_05195 [Phormidium willei BDU 130791]
MLRSLLIGVLRRLIATLERWLVRLERPELAEPLPLWQNPLVWIGAIAATGIAVVVAVVAVPQLTSEPTDVAVTPTPAPVRETPPPAPDSTPPVAQAPSQDEKVDERADNLADEIIPDRQLDEPEPSLPPSAPRVVTESPELSQETPPESPPESSPEPSPGQAESPKPSLATPKPIQLTPEQQLIAAVRSQISDVARPYEDCHRSGLNLTQQEECSEENRFVTRISANFEADLLRVEITPQWYDLNGRERSKLANGLWNQAQRLDFSHVEIVDPQGVLVARSPVVGHDVIILRRSRSSVSPTSPQLN